MVAWLVVTGCGESESLGETPIRTAPSYATVEGSSTVELRPVKATVEGSNPSPPAIPPSDDSSKPAIPLIPTVAVNASVNSTPVSDRSVGQLSGVEQWRGLVESIFPAFAVEAALQVMRCESGGNPDATGAAGEMGLFQVHPRWHPDATYDPEGNVRAAFRISGGGTSWAAWTCRPW